ncbi:hypothetical protein HY745_04700 [Candidatus Desantisbacteria bacterium]|nr:hypothetical protein [Candidatus Desantisbacteria bacterium]
MEKEYFNCKIKCPNINELPMKNLLFEHHKSALRWGHMRILIIASLLLVSTVPTFSTEYYSLPHQQTSSVPGARYEIVQSPLAAKWTFHLDGNTSRVWHLVKTKNEDVTWELMTIYEAPKIDSPVNARFQIFTSGLAARHTFLLDTETGMTWQIVSQKKKNEDGSECEVSAWQPFERP